jgi:hypothetical protein
MSPGRRSAEMLDLYADFSDAIFPASRWLILVLSVVDIVSTQYMMRLAGVDIETNPLYRWAWARAGKLGLWSIWLPIVAIVLWSADTPSGALFVCGFLTFILINNLLVIWSFHSDENEEHWRSVMANRGIFSLKVLAVCFAVIAVAQSFRHWI